MAEPETITVNATAPAPSSASVVVADSKDTKTAPGYVPTAMYPTKPTKFFVNIVDGQGNFATNEADISALIENAQLKNDAYAIVGIMGCQSSGKSTLLNLLFGTKFREMDSKQGRSQTTLGVWMDAGTNAHNLVVMDLEGTDSTERGEDRVTFERQTCMFALAMAEVLIVNMWEHDIGRYTASNIGILKTVFEVNLQLFAKQANYKTMLLFIIRDHIEEDTPMINLKTKISGEMNKVWSEVQKPEDHKNAALSDFFVFEYVALPHMKLARAKFNEDVGKLRDRFNKPSADDYLFNTPWHGKKAVPSDGFPHYALQVWESIKNNSDLNLPSQKEMLATYRCDEISVTAFNTFKTTVQPLQKKVSDSYADDFGKQATALLNTAMDTFEKVAGRYNAEVVAVKRKALNSKICDELYLMFQSQMKHAAKQTVHRFNAEAQKALGKTDEPAANFYTVMESARANAIKYFQKLYDNSRVIGSEWLVDDFQKDVNARLETIIAQQRSSQLDKVTTSALKLAKTDLIPDVSGALRVADDNMWSAIATAHAKTLGAIANSVGALGADFKCSAQEVKTIRSGIKMQVDELVRSQVVQHAELIQLKMRNKFERLFRLDADGIQIRFTRQDNVRAKYYAARDTALKLLDLFGVFQLSLFDKTDDLGNLLPVTETSATPTDATTAAAAASNKPQTSAATGVDAPILMPVALPIASPVGEAPAGADSKFDSKTPPLEADPHHAAKAAEDAKLAEERRKYLRQHPEEDPHNVIIRVEVRREREAEFLREIATILRETEDDIDHRNPKMNVPTWMYAVMVFLGWDEVMAFIRNPFLLTLAILIGGACFLIWKMGMAGPALQTIKTTGKTIYDSGVIGQTAMNFLKQFVPVETPATPTAAGAGAGGSGGSRTGSDGDASSDTNGPSAADLRASPATTPARVSAAGAGPIQRQVSAAVTSSTPKAQKPLTTPAMQRTTSHAN